MSTPNSFAKPAKKGKASSRGAHSLLGTEDPVVHLPEEDDILLCNTIGGDGRAHGVGVYRGKGHITEDEFHCSAFDEAGQERRFGLDHMAGAEGTFVVAVFVDRDGRIRGTAIGISLLGKADRDASVHGRLCTASGGRGLRDRGDYVTFGIGRASLRQA